jgi:hypothetical protein
MAVSYDKLESMLESRNFRSAAFAVASLLAVSGTCVQAQQPRSRTDPPLRAEWAMEVQSSARWMHGAQQPRVTPFTTNRLWLLVDSVRRTPAGRRIDVTLGESRFGSGAAVIIADRDGHIQRLTAGVAPFGRLGTANGGVSLPETRFWDLVPTFPQTARAGAHWTDTIARLATSGALRQSLRGVRVSTIVGDTIVDGRSMWLVHDSAAVQYEERYPETEPALDTAVTITRSAAGIIRGSHVFDPETGLFRHRDDTTALAGQAVLRYPDGRSFRTPARYERTRTWDLRNAADYGARMATLRMSVQNGQGGMVMVPLNSVQQRLADGDVATRDSVEGAWRRTTDPNEAAHLFSLLRNWSARDERSSARLDQLRAGAGDSVFIYDRLVNRAYPPRTPLDTTDIRAMLRFLNNPGAAWALNVSGDELYSSLVQSLTMWPRAVLSRSDTIAACTPAACALLGAQRRSAREPYLRDVALVALMSIAPEKWSDTVLALDGPRHPLLHSAALLAKGVGAIWPAASMLPMPIVDADWRAWLEWMDGRNPAYPGTAHPTVRFEESHITAIRFYSVRTHRDIVAELRHSYDTAASDSAKLVFGTMLQGLGESEMTEAEVATNLSSGVRARVTLARQTLLSRFAGSAALLDTATAAPLIERLLAAVIDSAPLWRRGVPDLEPAASQGTRPVSPAPIRRVVLNGLDLPTALQQKWATRVAIMSSAEWSRLDPRAGAVFYSVTPVRVWGRFARVEIRASGRLDRSANQVPSASAGATVYYLMNVNGAWVIVAQEGWVT